MFGNRLLIIFCSFLTLLSAYAQGVVHQQGYVRSVGRPENKTGKRLSGAVIKVSGQHNTVRSGQNGMFTLQFTGLREGKDSYSFSSVRLAGYDLQDAGVLGRRHPLSSTVPVEVVLVPQALKTEIEERVRRTVELQYQKKLRRVNALRAKDAERYQAELQRLEAEYEKRDQLITDMVNRYASTDYARLDSLSARINQFIENGELERADSLINAQDVSRLEAEHTALQARTAQLRSDLSQSEAASQASLRQLLSLYEGKRDIHIARFENDSAAKYWEKIVALDTTQVEHLLGADEFISDYTADYERGLTLARMALRQALKQYGEKHVLTALAYNDMASHSSTQSKFHLALEYYGKALDILRELYGDECPEVALEYNNIAFIYACQSQYAKALETYQKALAIYRKTLGEEDEHVATCYHNLGSVYDPQGRYAESLEVCRKALSIRLKVLGEMHPDVAVSYNCIGAAYQKLGQYGQALEYLDKSLAINRKIYGEAHPSVATVINNIGAVYLAQGQYKSALEYYEKARDILVGIYGEDHPDVALNYNNIGSVYATLGQNETALEQYRKALRIALKVHGEKHVDVARTYNNIGMCLSKQGQYVQAVEYYLKALSVDTSIFGEEHPHVATCYDNLGIAFSGQGQQEQALEYQMKALSIRRKLFGEEHPDVAASYNNIGYVYMNEGKYDLALEYFRKALYRRVKALGENHPDVATCYTNMGMVYLKQQRFDLIAECYTKLLGIYEHLNGAESVETATCHYVLGSTYFAQEQYAQAWKHYEDFMTIYHKLNIPEPAEILSSIYSSLTVWHDKSPEESETKFMGFMSTHMPIATIVPGGVAASRGLEGTYYVLEFGDWKVDCNENLFVANNRQKTSCKTVVLYRDGNFIQVSFDGQVGAQLGVKTVDISERDSVLKAWREWRK